MIEYAFLNWKLPGSESRIYSTEVIEVDRIKDLVGKLETLHTDYALDSVHPISQIFSIYSPVELKVIKELLENSLMNCRVTSEEELESYRRLLGPDLRHGERIFEEVDSIVDSLLKGGGKYDPVYIIRDFLKDPWSGHNEIILKAIEEAATALEGLSHRPDSGWSPDPARAWTVGDFLEVAGISTDGIEPGILTQELWVLKDDGMGYGAVNGPCIAVDRGNGNQVRVWM